MTLLRLRYSEFASRIDINAFEEAIGWSPESTDHKGNDIGYCPDIWGLHNNGDTTGKFAIHRDKRVYNCFVCGGGSLLSLVMALKDLHEEEALDFLYQFTTEQNKSDEDFLDEIDKILYQEKLAKPTPPWFNEHVLDKWNPRGNEFFWWWTQERGISLEIAARFQLGYAPEHQRVSRTKGEYTGPAIIFPHFWGGRLVGWQVRWLEDDRPKWVPKYTNTHDFPREETLYGYEDDQVYLSEKPIVVVESVPTKLFLASLGIPSVATFGSTVSDEQIRLLRRCQQGLILSPDNDKPGQKWIHSSSQGADVVPLSKALARFVPVWITDRVGVDGDGNDLGDFAFEPALAEELIEHAEPYF